MTDLHQHAGLDHSRQPDVPGIGATTPTPPPPPQPPIESMADSIDDRGMLGFDASPELTATTPAFASSTTVDASPTTTDVGQPAARPDPGSALSRLPRLPIEVALAMGMVIILLGVLVLTSRGSASDAQAERDAALTARATSAEQLAERDTAVAELASAATATEADMVALRARIAEMTVQLGEPTAADTELDDVRIDLEQARADLVTEQAAVERLEERAAELGRQLEAAADGDVRASILVGDDFARLVGEFVASADGLRIDGTQSRCLGRFLIDDLGVDAVGAGLHSDRTDTANNAVIQSMVSAAAVCDIDPSRIFGQ